MQQDAEELYSSLVNTLSQTLKEVCMCMCRRFCGCRRWLMIHWTMAFVAMALRGGGCGEMLVRSMIDAEHPNRSCCFLVLLTLGHSGPFRCQLSVCSNFFLCCCSLPRLLVPPATSSSNG